MSRFISRLIARIRQLPRYYFIHARLRSKLMFSFFTFALIPILLSVVAQFSITDPLLIKNLVELERESLTQYKSELDYRMGFYVTIANIISGDNRLNQALHKSYAGYLDMTKAYMDTFDRINASYTCLNNKMNRICIYSDNPTLICDNYYLLKQDAPFVQSVAYQNLFEKSNISAALFEDNKITYYRVMNYRHSAFRDPVLKILISTQEIYEPLQANNAGHNVFVFDSLGHCLSADSTSTMLAAIEPLMPEINAHTEGLIGKKSFNNDIVLYETTNMGWKIVKVIEPATFFTEALGLRNLIGLLLILCALLLSGSIVLLTRRLTRRINGLINKIGVIKQGNYAAVTAIAGKDEIGQASQALDDLARNLNYLIETVYKSQLENTRIELDMMQARINPHFLYNTLSAIDWFLQNKDTETSRDLLFSLVRFYRSSLGCGSDIVTLAEEVTHLRMYLDIEERLAEHIADSIRIPDSMLGLRLNRLSLQPIVENALLHAVRDDSAELLIEVTGYCDDKWAVIEVCDNGIGIPRAKAEAFNQNRTIPAEGSGIGLVNVDRRIRLRFGDAYGLHIVEKDTPGTIIQIRVPSEPPVAENALGVATEALVMHDKDD